MYVSDMTFLESIRALLNILHLKSTSSLVYFLSRGSLGFDYEVVSVVPVRQQVCGLLIVHPNVVIREHPWEEVIDLSGNIQDITHSAAKTGRHELSIICSFNSGKIEILLCQINWRNLIQKSFVMCVYPQSRSSSRLEAFHSDPYEVKTRLEKCECAIGQKPKLCQCLRICEMNNDLRFN